MTPSTTPPPRSPALRSLALIGMPGVGKSTIGVVLAKLLGLRFIDTDLLIQQRCGLTLQQLLDQRGVAALREAEQQVLIEEDFSAAVIATGGSAVYSQPGMARLCQLADMVWLRLPQAALAQRLGNFAERGIATAPGTSLAQLYAERQPLYAGCIEAQPSGITIDCQDLTAEQICAVISAARHTST